MSYTAAQFAWIVGLLLMGYTVGRVQAALKAEVLRERERQALRHLERVLRSSGPSKW